mmetsp:Transcript_22087/g.47411  ORF Transcript_22087/g.47411 Transcript_22087/m.47411 type:complete len:122 (-) Transcript_22087:134-499(-)
MTFVRSLYVAFVAIGWVVLLEPPMPCEAFVARPQAIKPFTTQLDLKRTVSDRLSFSKRSKPKQSENAEYEEDVYHRRIVHFEVNSERTDKKNGSQPITETTSDQTRKFGWDHRDFARSVDP